jgi:hypothetical protein
MEIIWRRLHSQPNIDPHFLFGDQVAVDQFISGINDHRSCFLIGGECVNGFSPGLDNKTAEFVRSKSRI